HGERADLQRPDHRGDQLPVLHDLHDRRRDLPGALVSGVAWRPTARTTDADRVSGTAAPEGRRRAASRLAMIRLEGVNKRFGHLHVLRDVSLEVQKGEVVCIIGPSGAGKSTLLRCINHLEGIDGGTIYLNGEPVYRYRQGGKIVVDPDRRIEEHRSE